MSPLALLHGAGATRRKRVARRDAAPLGTRKEDIGNSRTGDDAAQFALQGTRKKDIGFSGTGEANSLRHSGLEPESPATKPSRKRSVSFVAQYISKHIRRSAVKSALAALLAALLFFAVGWISELKASYTDLLAQTANTAHFVGTIPLQLIYRLTIPGYISGKYYEGQSNSACIYYKGKESGAMTMTVTNDINRCYGKAVEITYDGIHDESSMNYLGRVLVASRGFADMLGIEAGDSVAVIPEGINDKLFPFNVIGIIENEPDVLVYTPGAYKPGDEDDSLLFKPIEELEVTLLDDSYVDEFRTSSRSEIGEIGENVTLVMNTANLENLKNAQRLTEMLYPMAIVAALLIGGFLCCLLILQSSKEAAIMRVLGTTKRKTRAMLAAEQTFLSLLGLIAGMLVVLAYKEFNPDAFPDQILLFAALYSVVILVCGVVCSSLATRRPPLELLQVKE